MTAPIPAGTVANDALVAFTMSLAATAPAITAGPSGWVKVADDVTAFVGFEARSSVWVKLTGGSEPLTYDWTLAGTAQWQVVIYCWDNPRTATTFFQSISAKTSGVGTSLVSSYLPALQNATAMKSVAIYTSNNGVTFTAPAGMTERYDDATVLGLGMADESVAGLVPIGAKTATGSGSGNWIIYQLGLYSEDSVNVFTTVDDTAGGDDVVVLVPAANFVGRAVNICHGYDSFSEMLPLILAIEPTFANYFVTLLQNGYVIASSDQAGNNWGNQAGLDSSAACHAMLVADYGVKLSVDLGISMGGLLGLLEYAGRTIPGLVGFYGWAPACSLLDMYTTDPLPGVTDSIKTAFGIAPDGSDYASKTAGHDPLLLSPMLFNGFKLRFVASPDDTIVVMADNTTPMVDLIDANAIEASILTVSGPHDDPSHINIADTLAFFARIFDGRRPSQLTTLGVN